MVSFEIFVKAMPPSLSELKVLPSFCFAFKIPDDVTASNIQVLCGSDPINQKAQMSKKSCYSRRVYTSRVQGQLDIAVNRFTIALFLSQSPINI